MSRAGPLLTCIGAALLCYGGEPCTVLFGLCLTLVCLPFALVR